MFDLSDHLARGERASLPESVDINECFVLRKNLTLTTEDSFSRVRRCPLGLISSYLGQRLSPEEQNKRSGDANCPYITKQFLREFLNLNSAFSRAGF